MMQSFSDLWWKKWHWDRFLFEHFCFPLPIIIPSVFTLIYVASEAEEMGPSEGTAPRG
jgi:hypothetical protein